MNNLKAGIMLVLALGMGTVAAMMAHRWIQQESTTVASETENTTDVFVASREIPYGKTLDPSYLKTVAWPRDAVPKGAILASQKVEGLVVNQTVLPGELLMRPRVVDKLEGSQLSAVVTPNKRAITVRVNDVAGVAGFLLPGNHVDVLATRMEKRRAITITLLQNIKVLAVDQKANPDKDEPIVVRAVTLESDLDQAALLASATEEGTIQLVLRNPEDSQTEQVTTTVVEESEPALGAANKPRSRKPARRNVTIIRGTQVVKTRVRS